VTTNLTLSVVDTSAGREVDDVIDVLVWGQLTNSSIGGTTSLTFIVVDAGRSREVDDVIDVLVWGQADQQQYRRDNKPHLECSLRW